MDGAALFRYVMLAAHERPERTPLLSSTPAQVVLCASERITIPEIGAWGARLWPLIEAEMAHYKLSQTGPTVFVSHGRNGRVDQLFRHNFCVPIAPEVAEIYAGAFRVVPLPAVEHASVMLDGPFTPDAMAWAYSTCADLVRAAGRGFTGETREIYHRWSGPDAADNRVEIAIVCR
jgi:hypothetical protein